MKIERRIAKDNDSEKRFEKEVVSIEDCFM